VLSPASHAEVCAWLAAADPIRVLAWEGAGPDGPDPRSAAAEVFWLPVLGPSALWAARRLADRLAARPGGFALALGPFAAELGLGAGVGRGAPVVRALARLVRFGVAEPRGGPALGVRLRLPPLGRRAGALPPHLRAALAAAPGVVRPGPPAGPGPWAPRGVRA
jgi:hypothetical protein